jgi:hypothetical protein
MVVHPSVNRATRSHVVQRHLPFCKRVLRWDMSRANWLFLVFNLSALLGSVSLATAQSAVANPCGLGYKSRLEKVAVEVGGSSSSTSSYSCLKEGDSKYMLEFRLPLLFDYASEHRTVATWINQGDKWSLQDIKSGDRVGATIVPSVTWRRGDSDAWAGLGVGISVRDIGTSDLGNLMSGRLVLGWKFAALAVGLGAIRSSKAAQGSARTLDNVDPLPIALSGSSKTPPAPALVSDWDCAWFAGIGFDLVEGGTALGLLTSFVDK